MKKDRNKVHIPLHDQPIPGSAVFVHMAGQLTGYGQSHYRFIKPDYPCPHIILRGQGTVILNGQPHPVTPGDMFTIYPQRDIEYFEDPAKPWQYYWIHLEGPQAQHYVNSLGFNRQPILHPTDAPAIQRLFAQIFELADQAGPTQQYQLTAWLFDIAAKLTSQTQSPTSPPTARQRCQSAQAFIDAMLHTPINIEEIAHTLNISRTTLFRLFKTHLGISPIDYLLNQRLQRSCDLLINTTQTTADIAQAVGFQTDNYFFRRFKTRYHMTPTQFRRRHKNHNLPTQ